MAFSQGYVFGFATAICVICSLGISSVSIGLRDLQQANARRDQQANILMALGLNDGSLRGQQIDDVWEEKVEFRVLQSNGQPAEGSQFDLDGNGEINQADVDLARQRVKGTTNDPELLGVYARIENNRPTMWAIPVYGAGLWGPLSGYLAIDPTGREITGSTFFAPKETPGLGAEIQETPFEEQWVGKRIVDASGQSRPVRVVKGQAELLCPGAVEHCVDGLSGATITARGVDEMVVDGLRQYEPFLSSLRGGSR